MEQMIKTIILQHGPEILRNGADLAEAFADLSQSSEDTQLFCDFVDTRSHTALLDAGSLPLRRQLTQYNQTVKNLSEAVKLPETTAEKVCAAFWHAVYDAPVPAVLQQSLRHQRQDRITQAFSRLRSKLHGVKPVPLILAIAAVAALLLPFFLPSPNISAVTETEDPNAHPHGIPVEWKDSWRVYKEGDITYRNGERVKEKGEYLTQRNGYVCYENGKMIKNEWRQWDGRTYAFGIYGRMCTGLIYIDGDYYGFHKDTGEMLTGEVLDEWLTDYPDDEWDVTLIFDENGVYQYTKSIYYHPRENPDTCRYTWDDIKSYKKNDELWLHLGNYLPDGRDCTYFSVEASNITLTKGTPDGKWQLYLYYEANEESHDPEGKWVCYDASYHPETGTVTAEVLPQYEWYYDWDDKLFSSDYISRYLLVYDGIVYGAECSFDVRISKLVRQDTWPSVGTDFETWEGL